MNIKGIFLFVWEILTNPAKRWKELVEDKKGHEFFLEKIYYPLLGIMALCLFLSALLNMDTFNFQKVLKRVIVECVMYMGGLYGATYFVEMIRNRIWGAKKNFSYSLIFVGTCYAPKLLVESVFEFLPNLGLNLLLWGLIPYSVWNACLYYFDVKMERPLLFFFVVSFTLLLIPIVVRCVLLFLMPNL